MSLLHRHRWVTVQEHFQRPNRNGFEIDRCSEDVLLAILYGLTTIRQECSSCGQVALSTTSGDATLPPETPTTLAERADRRTTT